MIVGGADDIAPALDLLDAGPWVIHWLDARPEAVDSARRALRERGVYGRVSVERWDRDSLPYADNLVNLMVVRNGAQAPGREELLRVLAPEGTAFVSSGGGLARLDKPRPPEMGEWTHAWHGADGSPVGSDNAMDVPNAFQWMAGPAFPFGHRKNSTGVVLSTGGRVFYLTRNVGENLEDLDTTPYLLARDAFNGTVLWAKPWPGAHVGWTNREALHEAIVATEDRLYAARSEEIAVIDTVTGSVVDTWALESSPSKLALADGALVAQTRHGLACFDINAGTMQWRIEADGPRDALVYGGRVFCLVGTREHDGRWHHDVLALDLESGAELWRQPVENEYAHRDASGLWMYFAGDGFVTLIERRVLRALCAEEGRELWSFESETSARSHAESRMIGHFYAHGRVWVRSQRPRQTATWLALDPLTGEKQRELTVRRFQGSGGCQTLTATQRFVLDSGIATVWGFEGGQMEGYQFVKGGCITGIVPANGLAYVTPNTCGCLDEMLSGFFGLAHSHSEQDSDAPGKLQRGPAYGRALASPRNNDDAVWPMYRSDGRRGAYLRGRVPSELSKRWSVGFEKTEATSDSEWLLHHGRPLTPPVVADGLLLLAEPQTHQVIAMDKETGSERWRFTADGRVTVPPTFYRGLALFGAHDGYVYALDAADGELAWRRRAAPADRRIMAYGQTESAWPVAGGVLVHEGLALVAAGRAPEADGGMLVHALEPATGEVRWSRRIKEAQFGVCDLLVTDGTDVYLMDQRIDTQTGEATKVEGFDYMVRGASRAGWGISFPEGVRYLRGAKIGLLDTAWTRQIHAIRKGQQTWRWGESEGEIMAFTDETAYAFLIDAWPEENPIWGVPVTQGGGRIVARNAGADSPEWSVELPAPAQIEAMVVTENAIIMAGPEDRSAPEGAAFLRVLARDTGREITQMPLPVAPVHDGLAAANGSVFVVLRDGRVVRFDGE